MAQNSKIYEKYKLVQLLSEDTTLHKFFKSGSEPIKKIHQELNIPHNVDPFLVPSKNKLTIIDNIKNGDGILIIEPDSQDIKFIKQGGAYFPPRGKATNKYYIYKFTPDKFVGVENQTNPYSLLRDFMTRNSTLYIIKKEQFVDPKITQEPGTVKISDIISQVISKFKTQISKAYAGELQKLKDVIVTNLDKNLLSNQEVHNLIHDYRQYKKNVEEKLEVSNDDVTNFWNETRNTWTKDTNATAGIYKSTCGVIKIDTPELQEKFIRQFALYLIRKVHTKYFTDKVIDTIISNL